MAESSRLHEAALQASAAEARGDWASANEAWRRYRLIADAARDPDELIEQGILLAGTAIEAPPDDASR